MEDSAIDFIGVVLNNKYEVNALLGKGGTGNVFKARYLDTGMPVAIKILHSFLTADETAVKRFHREASLTSLIKHPNAVSVTDFGVINSNIFYLVMELITGISLSMLIKRESKLDIPRAVKIIQQMCMGVGAAHQLGIIHRDLKPGNVIIVDCDQPKELVKVVDFSIAKSAKSENLTGQGEVIGTPAYVSPEQAAAEAVDHRTDIYSMGVILYRLLTGKLPFLAKTPGALFAKHIHFDPQPPSEINPAIPPHLEKVVLRALAKYPKDRPQTAMGFAEELEASMLPANFLPLNNEAFFAVDGTRQTGNLMEGDTPITRIVAEGDTPTRIVLADTRESSEKSGTMATNPSKKIE
jgi:serine/threonine-protein kinase